MFLLYGKLWAIEIYWNYASDHLLSPHIKLFHKIKRGLEVVSLPHFLHKFWRKIFLLLNSINSSNFIVWLPLLCEILCVTCVCYMCVICGYMCVTIVCKPCSKVMNFEVKLIFLIKPLFLHDQNVVTKLKYLEDEKSF